MASVGSVVILFDQAIVLLFSRGDFEAVDPPNVSNSQDLRPHISCVISLDCRSKRVQMSFRVCTSQLGDVGGFGPLWHIIGSLDGVEIWQQGNCDPVQFSNAGVAADDYTGFPRPATAQQDRRFRTHAVE